MSRIDRALRIREGRKGALPTDADDQPVDDAASLQQYEREERFANLKPPRPAPEAQRPSLARRPKFTVDGDSKARLVTETSSAVSIEQYRKLAAVLHEEQVRSQLKTVIVTSALPGEGKTLTVVNLALTLSESYGRRVLVIDADLRDPSLHSALNVANDHGLSDALKDDRSVFFEPVSSRLA